MDAYLENTNFETHGQGMQNWLAENIKCYEQR